MKIAQRDTVGFALHSRNSVTIPGPWGVLALIWPPAAYAEAMRVRRESPPSTDHPK